MQNVGGVRNEETQKSEDLGGHMRKKQQSLVFR